MNNGVNEENNVNNNENVVPVVNNNTEVLNSNPEVSSVQPVQNVQPVANENTSSANTSEVKTEEVKPEDKEEEKQSLGSNVVIAPPESYYDENGQVNEKAVAQNTTTGPSYAANSFSQNQVKAKEEENKQEVKQEGEVSNTSVNSGQVTGNNGQTPTANVSQNTTQNTSTKDAGSANNEPKSKLKIKLSITPLLVIVIIALIGLVGYLYIGKNRAVSEALYDCTPVVNSDKDVKLDVNSNFVKDLYSRVSTNIKEDLAVNELNDDLKLYLAYRNLNVSDFYESNCNLFNVANSNNLTCDSNKFKPMAFSEESLQRSLKTLFGEGTVIANKTIQLGNTCLGGYQYIEKRKEYVEGECSASATTSLKVEKTLKEAVRNDKYVKITEEVKYIGSDKFKVPDRLQNGYYTHIFKLNSNYNYSYVAKEYRTKY